ncbi:MAG: hydantoinase B/oxoprolinase family protein [Thermodesulfobacteriota bacterium]
MKPSHRSSFGKNLHRFWIDVGGTFTDCLCPGPDGLLRAKVLSSGVIKGRADRGSGPALFADPDRAGTGDGMFTGYSLRVLGPDGEPGQEVRVAGFDGATGTLQLEKAPFPAIAPGTSYELFSGEPAPVLGIRLLAGLPLHAPIGPARVLLGTTRGTNALLTRTGGPAALAVTRGFSDVLLIGNQTREDLFSLDIRKPPPLFAHTAAISERVDAQGRVVRPLDREKAKRELARIRSLGVGSLAVCLVNSYQNPEHELALRDLALSLGFFHVSCGSLLSPARGFLDRAQTAMADAYLAPVIRGYEELLRRHMPEAEIYFATSAGALIEASSFVPKDSVLSGPAGGVKGFALAARRNGFGRGIGLDMGGTSTDVSRYSGAFEYEFAATKAGVRLLSPMLAVETVAAGGGSVCSFDGARLLVGPESAGADPGPACYGKNGPLTVTDVNFFLGRMDPGRFAFPLSRTAVERRLEEILGQMKEAGIVMSPEALAEGFLAVADRKMADAVKQISTRKGVDPGKHVLVAFGGAGPAHACAVADELGMGKILVPELSGLLSAYGIGRSSVARFGEKPLFAPYSEKLAKKLEPEFQRLSRKLGARVLAQGASRLTGEERMLDMRYAGEDAALTVHKPENGDWLSRFRTKHRDLYGFVHEGREVEVVCLRISVEGEFVRPREKRKRIRPGPAMRPEMRPARFQGAVMETAFVPAAELFPGEELDGPAVVSHDSTTIVVSPGHRLRVTKRGDFLLVRKKAPPDSAPAPAPGKKARSNTPPDPARLELFISHFSHIAAQMGETLVKTALSVNVKQRRDFSCAVLDHDANLIANAPHIPVHLGAMADTVRALLMSSLPLAPGDSFLTNHPALGGSHLPDLTVITPVFDPAGKRLRFFTASRAHHAEIGGVRPGSFFPFAKNLAEEGVVFASFPLVKGGELQERALREHLLSARHPSRSPDENVADLRAQLAANHAGAVELCRMTERYGYGTVQEFCGHIREAARLLAAKAIAALPDGSHRFSDCLDDGAPVSVVAAIQGERARFDFSGSAPVRPDALNAGACVARACVLYCLRCLIQRDVPLNSGIFQQVDMVFGDGMVNPPPVADPERAPAVVGGNVELSQRLVDVILAALGKASASQGTMNNFVFGNDRASHYETVCGGAGAGPGFAGAHAVHTHMTNTQASDVEVLESRLPVRVLCFAVRRGSGGRGLYPGGNGAVRALEFLSPMQVTLLTQRRKTRPFGLCEGLAGAAGKNLLLKKGEGRPRALGPLSQAEVEAGDRIILLTPGGGGWGEPGS